MAVLTKRVSTFPAKLENENAVQEFLARALDEADPACPPKARKDLRLAVEELFVNAARYAYAPKEGDVEVIVRVSDSPNGARVTLRDAGVPFDPFGHADPAAPSSVEETPVGGLGILMVKRLVDACSYVYEDGCNTVTVEKRW